MYLRLDAVRPCELLSDWLGLERHVCPREMVIAIQFLKSAVLDLDAE
jgi:hypothetical protein